MSHFNEIAATDFAFMLSEFGVSVTRNPSGGDPVSVDAIWKPTESDVNHETGKSLVWKGRLSLLSSQTVSETDEWTIDGETYQTIKVGKASAEMRVIDVQLKNRVQTNRSSGMLL